MKNKVAEILAMGIMGILILAVILGLVYAIYYFLIMGIFWAFGPLIFGYTFSHKIVLGVWLITIVLRSIFRSTSSSS